LGKSAHTAIRSVCPSVDKDRVIYKDLARISELIERGTLARILR
jgi:histidine ammonia-lyase